MDIQPQTKELTREVSLVNLTDERIKNSVRPVSNAQLQEKPYQMLIAENAKRDQLVDLAKSVMDVQSKKESEVSEITHRDLIVLDKPTECTDCDGSNPCTDCDTHHPVAKAGPTQGEIDAKAKADLKAKRQKMMLWGMGILALLLLSISMIKRFKTSKK